MQRLEPKTALPIGAGAIGSPAPTGTLTSIEPIPEPEGKGFGIALRALRERTAISLRELARRAAIDPGYLHRMEAEATSGRLTVPRRGIVLALARGLGLGDVERDTLLAAAGYCPEAIYRATGWDATLADVASILGDRFLDAEDKEQFRDTIQVLAARWRASRIHVSPPRNGWHAGVSS